MNVLSFAGYALRDSRNHVAELKETWKRQLINVGLDTYRLNEGFATYLSYIGMKRAEPEWDTESVCLERGCENLSLM